MFALLPLVDALMRYQLLSRTWRSLSVFTTRGVAGSLPAGGRLN